MLEDFRFIVVLFITTFFMLGVNNFVYAETQPANPDRTMKWEADSATKKMLRSSAIQPVEPVIADISHWQGTIDWELASQSLDLAIIRTQSGSAEDSKHILNENGAIQYGVPFGVYAYNKSVSTSDARVEATDFYHRASKDALFYVVDVEEFTSTSGESMREIMNAYVSELRKKTDKKIGVYIAHHLYKELNIDTSKYDFVWIPRYSNTNTPLDYEYDLWQYTDQGTVNGINTHMGLNRLNPKRSFDIFTSSSSATASLIERNYYKTNPEKIVTLKNLYQYEIADFVEDAKKTALPANSIVTVTGISYLPNGIPRLQLSNGYFISANKDLVLKVTENIDRYYTTVPDKIVVKKSLSEYSSTKFTESNKIGAIKKNRIVTINGIAYTAGGTPRLKTSKGTYITANKSYVKAYRTIGGSKVYSSLSSAVSAKPNLEKPATVKTVKASSTSIKVSWSKVNEASGYELYRAPSKSGTYSKIKTLTTRSMVSYTNKSLKKKKTYYYKVRAYRLVNGKKIYSSYTSVVSYKL